MKLFDDLLWRGLVKQTTSDEVEKLLNQGQAKFYCGFDPTASSLHIGSLLPLITMKRLQLGGNVPIALVGSFTASIGDPSFKSAERKMIDQVEIDQNAKGIESNIRKIVDCEMVNNLDWFSKISLVDFFRKVGKHLSVNDMLTKDSVKSRLENRDQGISFTEFSYMTFQGYDFVHLHKEKGVNLQVGGSDQFSNLVMGISLIRKMLGKEAYGMTLPLITKSDGTKFGKTEKGNVWLDPNKTSPFDFYQFFVRVEDGEVIQLLKFLTFLSREEIESLEDSLKKEPHLRKAQKSLAQELTVMVHGEDQFQEALKKTESLFEKKDLSQVDMTVSKSSLKDKKLIDLLVELGLSSSKTMARKDIEGKAISLNNKRVEDISLTLNDHLQDKVVIQKGKKNIKIIEVLNE